MSHSPNVHIIFHAPTFTCCYIVSDSSKHCAIIDSALDYDPASGKVTNKHVHEVANYVSSQGLTVDWILETHIHADHLTGAVQLKKLYPMAKTAISERVTTVQSVFKTVYNEPEFQADGHQFDHLWKDNETFQIGSLEARVLFTPGHTPACVSYVIGDCVFTGDTVFLPDYGTARCDFPKGSAADLYQSIQKLFSLPDDTKQYVGHVYGVDAEPATFRYMSTIGEQKAKNKHIKVGTTQEEFVAVRQARDATLDAPKLLLPSLQVNMRAGHLPAAESNGVSYLKIPVKIAFE